MLLVYGILCVVTICVTIVAVYYLLNGEDYRWWWLSFLSGGSWYILKYLFFISSFQNSRRTNIFFQNPKFIPPPHPPLFHFLVRYIYFYIPSTIFLLKHICMVYCKLPFTLVTQLFFVLVCF